MGKKNELPMLNSERKEWQEKVNQLVKEKDQIYNAVLRRINGIVCRHPDLTEEIKTDLLAKIWSEQT